MIKLSNVKIPHGKTENDFVFYASQKMKIKKEDIIYLQLLKKSLDARKAPDIFYICSSLIKVKNENKIIGKCRDASVYKDESYTFPFKNINSSIKPVIIGSGPAGLFCALMLVKAGIKPIIIERGKKVDERKNDIETFFSGGSLNTNSNIQFGEGGAGTFSDGKLTCGLNDKRMDYILKEFVSFGAPKNILTDSKPHIGTDYLFETVKNIRKEIENKGGKFLFNTVFTGIKSDTGKIKGIYLKDLIKNEEKYIDCSILICATGHSSRDTYVMLKSSGVFMERKPFSVGVRIEHKRKYINKLQYKEIFEDSSLPSADYKLSSHTKSGSCYTFCMCPGGRVVSGSSEDSGIVTNGMSLFKRCDENSNSAVLVSVTPNDIPGDDVLGGMYFQRDLERKAFILGGENYFAPCQRLEDFMSEKESKDFGNVIPSYLPGVKRADINKILPDFVKKTLKEAFFDFDKKMSGFMQGDAVLTGVETRSSSPVRIKREEDFQANIKGLYPIGEGAGYSGGIMSSALDGIKCAEKIAEKISLDDL